MKPKDICFQTLVREFVRWVRTLCTTGTYSQYVKYVLSVRKARTQST